MYKRQRSGREAEDRVRRGRDRSRDRRPLLELQRHRRRGEGGEAEAAGPRLHLRPFDPRRAGLHPGRKGCGVSVGPSRGGRKQRGALGA